VRAVVTVAVLLLGLLVAALPAQAAEAEVWAFVYADRHQEQGTYVPVHQKANPTSISAEVTRTGTGSYRVSLAGGAASGGVPMVTAVNGAGVHCQLSSFFRSGSAEVIMVGCYAGGVGVDSRFTLSFFSSTSPDSGSPGAYAYVFDDRPNLSTYRNPPGYNSTGGRIDIYRDLNATPLVWTVRFFGQTYENLAGNVQVSAHGSLPARCSVYQWYPHSLGIDAQVRCDRPANTSGTPQWTLGYANDRSLVGGQDGFFGYLQANEPTSPLYTPDERRNRAPSGYTHTVSRESAGRYEAQIYGPLKEESLVQLSVNGHTDSFCNLAGWTVDPNVQPAGRVAVHCYDAAGNPRDNLFTLNYYSP
jgi:hypothetical protein